MITKGILLGVSLFLFLPMVKGDSTEPIVERASYFVELMSENGGQVPYPFDKLVSKTWEMVDPSKAEPVLYALVPHGRSLARDATDFKNPRLLVAMGDLFPIFFGYAPSKGQVEVISFNFTTAEYDFHIISDYKPGGHPKVVAADRELCVQCHQHAGPIFPRSPWREMVERKPGTYEDIFKEHGEDSDFIPTHMKRENLIGRKILNARKGERNYYGVDLLQYTNEKGPQFDYYRRGPVAAYAFTIGMKNWNTQRHRVVKELCHQDLDCRFVLLRAALLFSSLRLRMARDGNAPYMKELNANFKEIEDTVKKYWPEHGFAFISDVIPDRQIPESKEHEIGYVVRPLLDKEDLTYVEMLSDYLPFEFYYLYNFKLFDFKGHSFKEFFEQKVVDDKVLDPKAPRPLVRAIALDKAPDYLWLSAFEGLNFSGGDRGVLEGMDYLKVKKILSDNKAKYIRLTSQWPPNTNKIMAALLDDMGRAKEAKLYRDAMTRYKSVNLPPSATDDHHDSKNLFVKYCAACHGSRSAFLPLENMEELKKIPRVCSNILKSTMPPQREKWQPTSEERHDMTRQLKCDEEKH